MSLPASVKATVHTLPPDLQAAFRSEYSAASKSTLFGWAAWLLLGWHYLYLGKVGHQIFFWLTFGGMGLWWIIDFFRVPGLVSRHNQETARILMAQIKAMSS